MIVIMSSGRGVVPGRGGSGGSGSSELLWDSIQLAAAVR